MKKTILITGSTDGIGLKTAIMLAEMGHKVLVHGRNAQKIEQAVKLILVSSPNAEVGSYQADLSLLSEVTLLAKRIKQQHVVIDVLINNAGVFNVADIETKDGLDARFMVNTTAPYLLYKLLLSLLGNQSRVINLSSAAQASLSADELTKPSFLADGTVYAQSKLALTMWTYGVAKQLQNTGPAVIAVNPKSLLGSKMVKQAYGIAGGDLKIGADILIKAALSEAFADVSGQYFDNDIGQFTVAHPDAANALKCQQVIDVMDGIIAQNLN
ncbi:SDR family NAD(P)-dependent oxidoreductase [Shewanella frigidimarina]|uniref:SDR family NAD(P)-dependent oxidoreductase n=1 Tax=Shewanella frigidimarina TaxID=56812 RepID=UPI003D7A68B8